MAGFDKRGSLKNFKRTLRIRFWSYSEQSRIGGIAQVLCAYTYMIRCVYNLHEVGIELVPGIYTCVYVGTYMFQCPDRTA